MLGADELAAADAIRRKAAGVHAPQRLRDALGAQQARRRRASVNAAAVAAAVTVVAAVLLVVHPGARPDRPSVAGVAAIALLSPNQAAPAPDARAPELLRAAAGGVRFPAYAGGGLHWRADGLRRARHEGRDVVAVSYRQASGSRVGYAIVSGVPLAVSTGARVVERGELRLAVLRRGATTIVTWRRGGRTCVLASRDASTAAMLAMAAWHPGGRSPERY